MKKIIYLVIRYSVLIENSRSWNISRNDLQEYKENLFNEDRLKKHFDLFKNITFPSILNQTKKLDSFNFKLMIITSEELPNWNKELLENMMSNYHWAEIHYLPTKGVSIVQPIYDDLNKYNEKLLFATIRLDDDDAIAIDFFDKFESFFTEANSGYALSFGLGLCGFYDFDKNQYNKLVEYYYPKFSAGLCYINIYNKGRYQNKVKTIFQAGSHSKVDRNVPTIISSKEIMFIRTMYDLSDSYDVNRENKLLKNPAVDPKVMEDRFVIEGFDRNFYFDHNFKGMEGTGSVDRTKYNTRFDLSVGKRIYHYKYKGLYLSFYAEFNQRKERVLVRFPNKKDINFSFLSNDVINEFEGTKIIFMNPKLILESIDSFSSTERDEHISLLLKEFVSEIIVSNSLNKENMEILNSI